MSDTGRAQAAKQPKKKKKDGESKGIIGKLHIPKKGKKKEDGAETPDRSKSPAVKLSDESGKSTETFLRQEAASTSTPVKKDVPKMEIKSPVVDSAAMVNAERAETPEKKPAERATTPEKNPAEVRPPVSYAAKVGGSTPSTSPEATLPATPVSTPTKEPTLPPPEVNAKEDVRDKDTDNDNDTDTASMDTATSEPEAQSGLKKECLYKILVIGELGTGKTSIIKRYVHQFFSQHYRATIGVDFALKVLNWDQNTIIRLQLWDIAGQERFGNMTRVYYKEAVGAFIVFDVTRAATFDAVLKWKQDLDAKVQLPDGSPIPCVLLANKCDQQKEGLVNNPSKMNEYCEEHKFTGWFETSAKENINIEEAAKTLVDQIVRNDSSSENGRNGARDLSKFPLESTEDLRDSKSCAC